MSQSPHIQDNTNALPQSVVYAYPPSVNINDEISLGDIFAKLIEQWKLMAAIVACGMLLSLAVALYLPSIYRVDTTLSLPTEADVSMFATNGLGPIAPSEIFKRYYNQVRSIEKFSNYIVDNDYLSRLYPNKPGVQGQLAGFIIKDFSVVVDEPLPVVKGGLVDKPERITIAIAHADELLIAELLKTYTQHVGTLLVKSIKQEQQVVINGKIKQLEAKIDILRVREKNQRLAEISRLKAKNKESVDSLNQQIEATIAKATADTKNKLIQIYESRAVAESLGITNPTQFKENRGNESQSRRMQSLAQGGDGESLPMFLMGTRYLDSLINSIKNRENEAAFVSELNDIHKEIALIENDAALNALISRESDDPYIKEVPDIQANIAELKSLSLDFEAARVYNLEKDVLATGIPIKPNRKLIVALGVVLSGMIALLVGVIVINITSKK